MLVSRTPRAVGSDSQHAARLRYQDLLGHTQPACAIKAKRSRMGVHIPRSPSWILCVLMRFGSEKVMERVSVVGGVVVGVVEKGRWW